MAKNVKSRVTINMQRIKRISRAAETALSMTAEALHTDVVQRQVVPRDTGALQGEKFFVDVRQSKKGKIYLVHDGPYARRLYYHPEYRFNRRDWTEEVKKKDGTVKVIKHGSNPRAKGKWLDDYKKGGKKQDFCTKTFGKIFKGLAGV